MNFQEAMTAKERAPMLTTSDLYLAAQAGIMRRISAIKRKRCEPFGTPKSDLWGIDIESCIAEYLVARAFNLAWIPYRQNPKEIEADVGTNVQVRSTSLENGSLILHKEDKDTDIFVLVIGQSLDKRIAGWIEGRNGKTESFWQTKTGRPCYFVPQSHLRSIEDFAS